MADRNTEFVLVEFYFCDNLVLFGVIKSDLTLPFLFAIDDWIVTLINGDQVFE